MPWCIGTTASSTVKIADKQIRQRLSSCKLHNTCQPSRGISLSRWVALPFLGWMRALPSRIPSVDFLNSSFSRSLISYSLLVVPPSTQTKISLGQMIRYCFSPRYMYPPHSQVATPVFCLQSYSVSLIIFPPSRICRHFTALAGGCRNTLLDFPNAFPIQGDVGAMARTKRCPNHDGFGVKTTNRPTGAFPLAVANDQQGLYQNLQMEGFYYNSVNDGACHSRWIFLSTRGRHESPNLSFSIWVAPRSG